MWRGDGVPSSSPAPSAPGPASETTPQTPIRVPTLSSSTTTKTTKTTTNHNHRRIASFSCSIAFVEYLIRQKISIKLKSSPIAYLINHHQHKLHLINKNKIYNTHYRNRNNSNLNSNLCSIIILVIEVAVVVFVAVVLVMQIAIFFM